MCYVNNNNSLLSYGFGTTLAWANDDKSSEWTQKKKKGMGKTSKAQQLV